MMLAKAIAFMLLAPCVHADVDIAVFQNGPDVEFVVTGSINLEGFVPSSSVGNLSADDMRVQAGTIEGVVFTSTVVLIEGNEISAFDSYELRGRRPVEGSIAGCQTVGVFLLQTSHFLLKAFSQCSTTLAQLPDSLLSPGTSPEVQSMRSVAISE